MSVLRRPVCKPTNHTFFGCPFGLGGLWENWKDPTSGE